MTTATTPLASPAEVLRLIDGAGVLGLDPRRDRVRLLSLSDGNQAVVLDNGRRMERAERLLSTVAGPDHNDTFLTKVGIMASVRSTPPSLSAQDLDRFWTHIDRRGPDDCWPWVGRTLDGYGYFYADGRYLRAHRVAYLLRHGTWPLKLCLHNCPGGDNRACCNPAHLWLGTCLDNNQDAARKGRTARGDRNGSRLRPETRPRGRQVNTARLNSEAVQEIRRRAATGESLASLATAFGVRKCTVRAVVRRRSWRHVR